MPDMAAMQVALLLNTWRKTGRGHCPLLLHSHCEPNRESPEMAVKFSPHGWPTCSFLVNNC